jgi:CheY-like chemotaxis protein
VDSEPGKGTKFRLVIPYKIGNADDSIVAAPDIDPAAEFHFHNHYVLVVEDNQINQRLISYLFKNWKLQFDAANNGAEAIEKLKRKNYDLILMDIQMPVMDGYETMRKMKENGVTADIPVIAVTARAMKGDREKCLKAGASDYISKPVNLAALLEKMERLISVSKTSNERLLMKNTGNFWNL